MRTLLFAPMISVLACSSSTGKGPVLASSTSQASYAIHYADELAAANKAIGDAQWQDKTLSASFAARVDDLKKPDWDTVQIVIDDSEEAGRSADFSDAHGEVDAVRAFWDAEKDTINGRVVGSAQHTLKEAGCTADVSGGVVFAMNEVVNKQLLKRLHARNEAFVVLDRYKTSLGPENVTKLEKLAEDVSQASYDVHVVMVAQHERWQRLLGDKDAVKKTLDRYVQDETSFQGEPRRTDAEKKASQDRVTAANKGKADIDAAAAQADRATKELDASIGEATKHHDEALKTLRAKVMEKKKAEPPTKTT